MSDPIRQISTAPLLPAIGGLEERGVFDALQDRRKKRIRDIRNRDDQLSRPQCPQILRRAVGLVSEPLHDVDHLAASGLGDHVRPAQDT